MPYAAYLPALGWTANTATEKMPPVLLDRSSPPPPFTVQGSVLYHSIEPLHLPRLDDKQAPFRVGTALPERIPGIAEEIAEIITGLADQNPGSLDYIHGLGWFPEVQKALRWFALSLGLEPEQATTPRTEALLPLSGSVQTHTDDGLGWYLTWVLYAQPLKTEKTLAEDMDPELVAVGGPSGMTGLVLAPGSLFAFNADHFHGWIYNGHAIIAQIPLKGEEG